MIRPANDAAPDRGRRRAIALDVAMVVLFGLGVRLVWLGITPPWAAPDEGSHFTYVAHLVELDRVPSEGAPLRPFPEFSPEVLESWTLTIFGNVSRGGLNRQPDYDYFPIDYDYRKARRAKRTPAERRTSGGATASSYPPPYYTFASLGYRAFYDAPVLTRLYAVRAASALLGALTCGFAYLLAYELQRRRAWGLALGLAIALFPMHVFITSAVNNDAGLVLGCTAICWLMLRCLHRPLTPVWALALGLSCGLTMLMKPTGSPVVLAACSLVALKAFPLQFTPLRLDKQRVLTLMSFAAGALATYGSWLVYRRVSPEFASIEDLSKETEWLALLSQEASHSFGSYLRTQCDRGPNGFFRLLVGTYWGNFGWLELPLPNWVHTLLKLVYAAGIVGIALQLRDGGGKRKETAFLLALVVIQGAFLFLVADYLLTFAPMGHVLGLQGRYFFPTLAPWLLLLGMGFNRLFRGHRWVPLAIPMFVAIVHLAAFETMVEKWYGVAFG